MIDNVIDGIVSSSSEEIKNSRKELVKQRQIVNRLSTEQNSSENIRLNQHVTPVAADVRQAPGRSRRVAGRSGMDCSFFHFLSPCYFTLLYIQFQMLGFLIQMHVLGFHFPLLQLLELQGLVLHNLFELECL